MLQRGCVEALYCLEVSLSLFLCCHVWNNHMQSHAVNHGGGHAQDWQGAWQVHPSWPPALKVKLETAMMGPCNCEPLKGQMKPDTLWMATASEEKKQKVHTQQNLHLRKTTGTTSRSWISKRMIVHQRLCLKQWNSIKFLTCTTFY